MLQILSITGPIYLLIAVGYAAVRLGAMQKADMRVLGRFVFLFGMPCVLFSALTQRAEGTDIEWSYILVYGLGSMATMIGMIVYARRVRGADVSLAGIQGIGVAASNTAFVGYPILSQVLGPVAGLGLAMGMIVENLLIMPLALAYADSGGTSGNIRAALKRSLASLVRNPLLMAIALGLIFNGLGWHLPATPARVVQMVALCATPLALFVVGGSLVGLKLGGKLRDVMTVSAVKLLVHPLLVLGALLLIPISDPKLAAAVVLYSAMPMASLLPVLAQKHHHEEFGAATLLVATTASFVTISLLLAVTYRILQL